MKLLAPAVVETAGLADAIASLRRADLRMALCPAAAVDATWLLARGSFTTPGAVGSPYEAAAALVRQLGAAEHEPLRSAIECACAAFEVLGEGVRVDARMQVAVPPAGSTREPPEDLTAFFHRDLFTSPVPFPLLRLVHVLAGPGTRWVPPDAVDEGAMARWEAHMTALHLAGAPPGERARSLHARVLRDADMVRSVPAGTIAVRKRNIVDEIVHCAPRSDESRIVLFVDELA